MREIWILGATGRTGRSIAALLAAEGEPLVLVGRDAGRLGAAAGTVTAVGGTARTVVAGSVEETAAALRGETPAVVVNTIGPFAETAPPIVRACPPGTHYVDLTNELRSVAATLDLHEAAVAAGQTLVAGAGFGVLATESVVLRLCEGRPPAERVRVDALAAVGTEPGLMGYALAAALVDGVAAGGGRYADGRFVRDRLGGAVERFALPDGTAVSSGSAPSGELEAARRASGAGTVTAASGAIPTGRAARAVLPLASLLLARPALGGAAKRRLARVKLPERPAAREISWARARVGWADGSVREGWLRAGDGMDFTAAVAAETAGRLARGEGRPGAFTPGALFGACLAESAGGSFVMPSGVS
ncbi:Uncharacterized conserved protein [Actinacidiphila alni]|uniref:Uncharacterized conserved protein n=1 Tax=Actinacidiphila alni TaxID=380248 RepID=A0A1I2AKU1_9ACTN|nr:saccharopine dehydrogenase NADP-binding domain-containing protein [Actinacidiphila alni]SFE44337.1 Uncharacterized conserved protein [Actinacidiphila alni]